MMSFGSDPEFMLRKGKKFYSAIRIVRNSKENRLQIGAHQYYYDNVLAECAIHPGNTKQEVVHNFQECFRKFAEIVRPYELVTQASAEYPAEQLTEPEAKEIGCDPELDVYTLLIAPPPTDEFQTNRLRSAGGHIHLGTALADESGREVDNGVRAYFIIRMLDLFLGIPSVFLDIDRTTKRRKKLYGKAGRFRLPEHGVEYRSLGNYWLSSPKLVELVYDICDFTLEFIANDRHYDYWSVDLKRLEDGDFWAEGLTPSCCYHCSGYDANEMRKAIDTNNRKSSKPFLDMVVELLPNHITDRIYSYCENSPTLEGFYKEWHLKN